MSCIIRRVRRILVWLYFSDSSTSSIRDTYIYKNIQLLVFYNYMYRADRKRYNDIIRLCTTASIKINKTIRWGSQSIGHRSNWNNGSWLQTFGIIWFHIQAEVNVYRCIEATRRGTQWNDSIQKTSTSFLFFIYI